jgi:hypothetical protein
MKVELLYVPGCPNVNNARLLLRACLHEVGLEASIEEREGDYPSPTILLDGQDVMGSPASVAAACRLDVPTRERVLAALLGSSGLPQVKARGRPKRRGRQHHND